MATENLLPINGHSSFSFSPRDLIAIGYRHKRPVVISFCAILLGAVLAAVFQPSEYQASTKFLIERERMDFLGPIVSPGQEAQVMMRGEVTEEQLNSEVELLNSEDVLRQVVLACGLHERKSLTDVFFR